MLAVPVLALCFAVDLYLARREVPPRVQKFRVRGALNIMLLLLLMLAIPVEGLWHPGMVTSFWVSLPGEQLAITFAGRDLYRRFRSLYAAIHPQP